MTAWMRGVRLSQADFAEKLFGRGADDPIVRKLHSAALDAGLATSHADLAEAAGTLADVIKAIGFDSWPRFVAEAQARARDPLTIAAVEKSRQPPDPGRDAIRPVYPIETAFGIAVAGIVGGAAGAIRAAGGAAIRQVLPESRVPLRTSSSNPGEVPKLDASAASVADKLSRYLLNPKHSVGSPKAKWFQRALGFTRQNSGELARQIVFDESKAVQTAVTEYGTKFNQVINIVGANGRTIQITTAWIKGDDGIVRLITAIPGR